MIECNCMESETCPVHGLRKPRGVKRRIQKELMEKESK